MARVDTDLNLSGQIKQSALKPMACLTLLGACLRFVRLDYHLPWFDEVLCIFQSEHIPQLLDGSVLSNNPPLFYLFLGFWRYFGDSLFFLRLFPACLGVLAIPLTVYLGTILFDRKTGFWAGLVLAVSPMHMYYSQEIKMYSMNVVLVLISWIVLHKLHQRQILRYAVLLGLVQAIMMYTHYYLFIQCITLHLVFLSVFDLKSKWKLLALADLITILLFAPWLHIYLTSHVGMTLGYVTSWIPAPGLKALFYSYKNFLVGFHSPRWLYWPFLVSMSGVILFGILRQNFKKMLIVLAALTLPVTAVFMISQFMPLYLDRYFLYVIPSICLLCGVGLKQLYSKFPILAVLLSVLPVLALPNVYSSIIPFPHQIPGEHPRPEFRQAINELKKHFQPDDKILHVSRRTNISFEYAWPESRKIQTFVQPDPWEHYPEPSFWPHSNLVPAPLCDYVKAGQRVWVVLDPWYPDPMSPDIYNTRQIMRSHGKLVYRIDDFGPLVIDCYELESDCVDSVEEGLRPDSRSKSLISTP